MNEQDLPDPVLALAQAWATLDPCSVTSTTRLTGPRPSIRWWTEYLPSTTPYLVGT